MNKWHTFYLLVVTGDGLYILDMAAKIDATADYICKAKWGDVEFPPPFGREAYPEVTSVTFQIKINQVERVWTYLTNKHYTLYFKFRLSKKTASP